jgi:hypothetical protein
MSDEVQAALSRLANAIGDREGLDDLGVLFESLDENGTGELDREEFTHALRKFGIMEHELSESDTSKLFDVVDTDHGGTIDFEEFSAVAKCELEMATLAEDLEGVQVEQQAMGAAAAAVKSGVRLNRTNSTIGDMKMQGDLEMLTQEAVNARKALENDPRIKETVQTWWDAVARENKGQMNKEQYVIFNVSLHKHFVPGVTDEDACITAGQDWEEDCPKGKDAMRFGKL